MATQVVPPPQLDRLRADVDALARFREPDEPGWTRRVFTPVYAEAREWLAEQMREVGLKADFDEAGNLVGMREGTGSSGLPDLGTGSHTDTVRGGGRYDGIVGVLGALEAVRLLNEGGIRLRHGLRVFDFLGEEPNDFGLSCLGSRALAGHLQPEHLELTGSHSAESPGAETETLGSALRRAGLDPNRMLRAALGSDDLGAFVELHVEQGPILEHEGLPAAVVSTIAGISRALVKLTGRSDHAGTTPMELRRDALAGAAELVLAVEKAGGHGGVATTGRLEIEPAAANIVPGVARLWCEFRSPESTWLGERRLLLEEAVREIAVRRGLAGEVRWLSAAPPVPASRVVAGAIESALQNLGLPYKMMTSGAGHDAAHMAALAPMGMIFIPSREGRSHVPEEFTELSQVGMGARILAQTLLELDGRAEA